ncbi:hypothetical protein CLOM_g23675 [Closterium sp. NIES-68]|nr:hypothetical protein CLOM_g23675 [Closterium sp. NIES-68]GJP86899.1 hypothetical protein CLOP_g16870 [Closterium sp. NIES-67]
MSGHEQIDFPGAATSASAGRSGPLSVAVRDLTGSQVSVDATCDMRVGDLKRIAAATMNKDASLKHVIFHKGARLKDSTRLADVPGLVQPSASSSAPGPTHGPTQPADFLVLMSFQRKEQRMGPLKPWQHGVGNQASPSHAADGASLSTPAPQLPTVPLSQAKPSSEPPAAPPAALPAAPPAAPASVQASPGQSSAAQPPGSSSPPSPSVLASPPRYLPFHTPRTHQLDPRGADVADGMVESEGDAVGSDRREGRESREEMGSMQNVATESHGGMGNAGQTGTSAGMGKSAGAGDGTGARDGTSIGDGTGARDGMCIGDGTSVGTGEGLDGGGVAKTAQRRGGRKRKAEPAEQQAAGRQGLPPNVAVLDSKFGLLAAVYGFLEQRSVKPTWRRLEGALRDLRSGAEGEAVTLQDIRDMAVLAPSVVWMWEEEDEEGGEEEQEGAGRASGGVEGIGGQRRGGEGADGSGWVVVVGMWDPSRPPEQQIRRGGMLLQGAQQRTPHRSAVRLADKRRGAFLTALTAALHRIHADFLAHIQPTTSHIRHPTRPAVALTQNQTTTRVDPAIAAADMGCASRGLRGEESQNGAAGAGEGGDEALQGEEEEGSALPGEEEGEEENGKGKEGVSKKGRKGVKQSAGSVAWHADFPFEDISVSTLLAEAASLQCTLDADAHADADVDAGVLGCSGGQGKDGKGGRSEQQTKAHEGRKGKLRRTKGASENSGQQAEGGGAKGSDDCASGCEGDEGCEAEAGMPLQRYLPPHPPRQLKKVPPCNSTEPMAAQQLLEHLKQGLGSLGQVVHCEQLPQRNACYRELASQLCPATWHALARLGVSRLYSHQAKAIDAALAGQHAIIATATASGKSLCYNVPVIHTLLSHPHACALYLFPTKALAQDQLRALHVLVGREGGDAMADDTGRESGAVLGVGERMGADVAREGGADVAGGEQKSDSVHVCGGSGTSVHGHASLDARLRQLGEGMAIYDGDTGHSARRAIRERARLILSNPDMLHVTMLPGHRDFNRFLSNLCYVVVDEAHAYRGAFGCHAALIFRRLRRLCAHVYGSDPIFIVCSATCADPREHVHALLGLDEVEVVDACDDGSPCGDKSFVLWNPPITMPPAARPLRRSSRRQTPRVLQPAAACEHVMMAKRASPIVEVALLLAEMVQHDTRCLAFCKTRKLSELVLTYTKEVLKERAPHLVDTVLAYRAGYTAQDRRHIERELFHGRLRAVAATNALELGVDVGALDATIHLGFQGSTASLWQQAGRAGRREKASLSIYVAFDGPLDQYFMAVPSRLFARPIERCQLDCANPLVMRQQLQCAAAELPLLESVDERFFGPSLVGRIAELAREGVLGRSPENPEVDRSWRYIGAGKRPARFVPVRAIDPNTYAVVEARTGRVLEEIEESKAFFALYEGAVYLQQGRTFLVTSLDLEKREARCVRADVRYYTKTIDMVTVTIKGGTLAFPYPHMTSAKPAPADLTSAHMVPCEAMTSAAHAVPSEGVTSAQTAPPSEGMTSAQGAPCDVMSSAQTAPCEVTTRWIGYRKMWRGSGEPFETVEMTLPDVTYATQAVWVGVAGGTKAAVEAAGSDYRASLHAAAHAIANMVPLFLACMASDMGVECASPYDSRFFPQRLLLYDKHPGGIGLAVQLQPLFPFIIRAAHELVTKCQCNMPNGCPGCVHFLACGEYNVVLDKKGAQIILKMALDSEAAFQSHINSHSLQHCVGGFNKGRLL